MVTRLKNDLGKDKNQGGRAVAALPDHPLGGEEVVTVVMQTGGASAEKLETPSADEPEHSCSARSAN